MRTKKAGSERGSEKYGESFLSGNTAEELTEEKVASVSRNPYAREAYMATEHT